RLALAIMATNMKSASPASVQCPVCFNDFTPMTINLHLDACLLEKNTCSKPSKTAESEPPLKKHCVNLETKPSVPLANSTASGSSYVAGSQPSGMFSVFQTDKSTVSPQNGNGGQLKGKHFFNKGTKGKPLADILRPDTLEEYFGQNKVIGQQTLLRSLLESEEIPSFILWGPPGCGKTTLAHIIAGKCKRKGTARFVTLSATSASVSDVREVIKQAQNELRLCKRKTVLFIDEIHRFNKSQQDTFLPHVECGTVILIGATTENPSFQVNTALLSRCRVLVLEKLSVEAMASILDRALAALGIRVLDQDSTNSSNGDQAVGQDVFIERKGLWTPLAYLCDGDARTGLNSLQLAVQAQVSASKADTSGRSASKEILVKEEHIKEGLQRSHILYDKAGEEHYNCISALHKSMRGSDENASLYWLGRMLEGGEDPIYVARRMVRFASEDVGLADPAALSQAVSAFQACHFIGMPECEVILAQCAIYLARAPKSIEVYQAYANVKACLRNHKGPLPSVPLHLRNAPTRLMKDLGYSKGYKYNPSFSGPVEQEYLPQELQGVNFFTWSPAKS
uniref:WRN helicase interacting protein 1 n=1 Tax=Tetraodon nigroviridis TaxID=99883 RepID=H3CSY0_TETNG